MLNTQTFWRVMNSLLDTSKIHPFWNTTVFRYNLQICPESANSTDINSILLCILVIFVMIDWSSFIQLSSHYRQFRHSLQFHHSHRHHHHSHSSSLAYHPFHPHSISSWKSWGGWGSRNRIFIRSLTPVWRPKKKRQSRQMRRRESKLKKLDSRPRKKPAWGKSPSEGDGNTSANGKWCMRKNIRFHCFMRRFVVQIFQFTQNTSPLLPCRLKAWMTIL